MFLVSGMLLEKLMVVLKLIDPLMLLDMLQRMLKLVLLELATTATCATDGSGTGTKTSLDAGTGICY